jgi:predicted RNA binding protein YcfA (HicA-like mRNA interferase family)
VRRVRHGPTHVCVRRAAEKGTAMSVRELLQDLRALGCQPERTSGSHQVWCTPGGTPLPPVVVNHANADVTRLVLSSIRRVLRREGLRLPSEQGKEQA